MTSRQLKDVACKSQAGGLCELYSYGINKEAGTLFINFHAKGELKLGTLNYPGFARLFHATRNKDVPIWRIDLTKFDSQNYAGNFLYQLSSFEKGEEYSFVYGNYGYNTLEKLIKFDLE